MSYFVTHMEGAIDGTRLPAGQIQTLHNDASWVRYDLQGVATIKDRHSPSPP